MAVDYLSSLNVGSGLNTTEIIDALVEAARAPKASEINSAKEKRTVEISSLGQIKQGFETFDTGLAAVEEITGLSVASSGSAIDVKISDAKLATNFSHPFVRGNGQSSCDLVTFLFPLHRLSAYLSLWPPFL